MSRTDNVMIPFLQKYLQIDTSMPDPDYEAVGKLFAAQAAEDGFLFNRYLLPSGYPCFVITILGIDSTLSSVVFNHHMDVVPVFESNAWSVNPFEGYLVNNAIIGRGVQDTKGLGVVHYFALREYVRQHILKRTVHLFLVPDEECGGFKGTAQLVEQPFFKDLNVGFVFDEGPSSGNLQELVLKVDERRPLQVKITCTGTAGHGSHLYIDNALHKLSRIVAELAAYQELQKKSVNADPGLVTSCNITHMSSSNDGTAYNVVPHEAYAIVDIRICPYNTRIEMQAMLDSLCHKEGASYSILASVPERSHNLERSTVLFKTVATIVQRHGFHCRAIVSEGASDLRFYWERGIIGIGFAPFVSVYNAHGINESLTIAELITAKDILRDCIHALNTRED